MKRNFLVSLTVLLLAVCFLGMAFGEVRESNVSIQVGSPIPVIELPAINGKIISTDSFKGSPLLLTFFSTWSNPCYDQLLFIQQLSKKIKDLKVIAVSFDKKSSAVGAFLSKNGFDFTCLIDKKLKYLDDFHILMIPTTFLVDGNGDLRKIYIDYDDSYEETMTADVKEILAEKEEK